MNAEPPAKRMLLAIRPDALPIAKQFLGNDVHVVICHTLKDAKAKLHHQIGLIACGVHFDGGEMFDLLRYAKTNPETKNIPFYLLIANTEGYSAPILQGIRRAAMLLGADSFVDLSKLQNTIGEAETGERIRETIRAVLS